MRPPKLNKKSNVHLFKLKSGCGFWSPGRLLVLNTTEWCLGAAEPWGIHRKSELPHPNLIRKNAFWGLKWLKWLNIKLWMVKYGEILVAKMANPSIFAPKNHHGKLVESHEFQVFQPSFCWTGLPDRYPVIKRGLLENIPFIRWFCKSYKSPQLVQGLPLDMFDMFDDIGGQIIGYKPIIYIYMCVCVFFISMLEL